MIEFQRFQWIYLFITTLLLQSGFCFAQAYLNNTSLFEAGEHLFNKQTIPFRIFIPEPGEKRPLVMALHGVEARGNDNFKPIERYRLILDLADSVTQREFPCFIVVPQFPHATTWQTQWVMETVIDLLDSLVRTLPVNADRLYVTGYSQGGIGTYGFIQNYPQKFAAAVPCCGRGDIDLANRILHIPIWIHHGNADASIAVTDSRDMVVAFEVQGRTCLFTDYDYRQQRIDPIPSDVLMDYIENGADCLYSEYNGADHMALTEPFSHPLLYQWMFRQVKSQTAVRTINVPAETCALYPVFPNPFNPVTAISYQLSTVRRVRLDVIGITGRCVRTLVDGEQEAGMHQIVFQGEGLASGIYSVRLSAGNEVCQQKVVLVR